MSKEASKPVQTILVAVDGSKDSDNAFNYAVKRSGPQDKLVILNARPDTDAANYMVKAVSETLLKHPNLRFLMNKLP